MKKVILAAIAVMAFNFVDAQDVKFGIKGGFNLSSLAGDIENQTINIGIHLGGFAEFKVADKFHIQPELLYSAQGCTYEQSGVNYLYIQELYSSYLNIPIMAKYYVMDKLSLEAGPQIGFLLSAKGKYEVRNGDDFFSGNGSVKNLFKTVDFGLNIGAGYDFTKNISAGVRYNFGLSNAFESQNKAHNRVLSLSVGYKF